MDTTQEPELFVIEKNVPKVGGRGPRMVKDPQFFRIKTTMDRMQRTDSFVFPLNGLKAFNIKSWVKKIEKAMNANLLDPKLREKNSISFSCIIIKDQLGTHTGVRIYRDN